MRFPSGNQCANAWLILSLVSSLGSPAPVVSSFNCPGDSCVTEITHFPSGDRALAPPSPSRTAGEPSVLRMYTALHAAHKCLLKEIRESLPYGCDLSCL